MARVKCTHGAMCSPRFSFIYCSFKARVKYVKGDVGKESDVLEAVRGATCVFHVASYGMSGLEQERLARAILQWREARDDCNVQILCPDEVRRVNIGGTRCVIRACLQEGVSRLVSA